MRKNLEPKIWGAGAWKFLHDCVYAADNESRASYDTLMRLLPDILPCAKCRSHARVFMQEHPPDRASDLDAWLTDFENQVRDSKRAAPRFVPAQPSALCRILVIIMVALIVLLICCRA